MIFKRTCFFSRIMWTVFNLVTKETGLFAMMGCLLLGMKKCISKSTKSYLCSLKIPTKGLYKKNSDRNAAKISKHRPNEKLFIQTGASSLSNLLAIKISIKELYTMWLHVLVAPFSQVNLQFKDFEIMFPLWMSLNTRLQNMGFKSNWIC